MTRTKLLDSAGNQVFVQPGSTPTITGTLYDHDDVALDKASVLSLECRLTDLATGEVINSRNWQDVLDANNGSVAVDGTVTFKMTTADTPIINDSDLESQYETHVFALRWSWQDAQAVTRWHGEEWEIVMVVGTDPVGGVGYVLHPVAQSGALRSPLVIGDDYLAPNREFSWRIDAPSGFVAGTSVAKFRSWPSSCTDCGPDDEIFDVTGTITESTVSGETVWDVTFDVASATTELIDPGNYDWMASVESAGGEKITFAHSADHGAVDWVCGGI